MHLLHKWVKVKHTGKHTYFECRVCGTRKVRVNYPGAYQPLALRWLDGGDEFD